MKWQKLVEDELSEEIYTLCRIIYAVEDVWIETGSEEIYVSPGEAVVYVPASVSSGLLEELQQKYTDDGITFVQGTLGARVLHYRDLYGYVKERFLEAFAHEIKRLIELTEARRREHAIIIPSTRPVRMLLEGEEDRIVLPELPLCIFLHTHPGDNCMPSQKDLESAVSFFSGGGVIEVIAARKCMFVMWREWLLSEEDIEKLIDVKSVLADGGVRAWNKALQMLRQTPFRLQLTSI